jgi:Ulp1 family protease
VHFFTTHLYVLCPIERGDFDEPFGRSGRSDLKSSFFEKKLLFIPIHTSQFDTHWSLCVVVNPGHVMSLHENKAGTGSRVPGDPCPILLHLDSAAGGCHKAADVQKNVTEWLNREWFRSEGTAGVPRPFDSRFRMLHGSVLRLPQQDNGFDCGVYVCRYIFGFLCLRDRAFSFAEFGCAGEQPDLNNINNIIATSGEFRFAPQDIVRIREELRTLIQRSSTLYKAYKAWQLSGQGAEDSIVVEE